MKIDQKDQSSSASDSFETDDNELKLKETKFTSKHKTPPISNKQNQNKITFPDL